MVIRMNEFLSNLNFYYILIIGTIMKLQNARI